MRTFHPFDPNDWLARHPKVLAVGMFLCFIVIGLLEEVR